jgi:hypothetical protein
MVFCCAACLQARAQVCQTSGNMIRSVSVNDRGEPVITWDAPADLPGNATGYIIYDYVGGAHCMDIITTVGLGARSYTHAAAKPLSASRAYSIAFETGSGNDGDLTQQHAFPWLEAVYDSCRYALDLQWTPYTGWGRVTYNIYGGELGTSLELLASSISGLQYTYAGGLRELPDNEWYEVYVEAVNTADPAAKSRSNRVAVFTKTLQRPAHLSIQRLRYAGHQVQLEFTVDPATRLATFHVMRSSHFGGEYAPVHTFSGKTLQSWTDEAVHSMYYYRLAAENNCRRIAKQGNVLNNMELFIKPENGEWHLSWNKLHNGRSYSLERLEPSPQQLLSNVADTAYRERIDASAAALSYCYRVASVTDIGGKSETVACADYEPEVWMPDAINPQSAVRNPHTGRQRNRFGPVLFIDPSAYAYRLEIYDHNGGRVAAIEKAFTDSPLEKSWTGVNGQGVFVPENMYLYRLELSFTNGKTIKKTGNVAVIMENVF